MAFLDLEDGQPRHMHDVIRYFKKGSPLEASLINTGLGLVTKGNHPYSLLTLLIAIRETITEHGLFDPLNPIIILCDDALEHAIGRSAFHTSHITKILCEHLVLPPDMIVKVPILGPSFRPCWAPPASLTTIHHVMSTNDAAFNTSGYYWVKPVFLDIINTMPCAERTSIVYLYHRIRQLLYLYLASHINGATITRCETVLVLKHNPLGSVFNVQALSFDQVDFFLRYQLILYNGHNLRN